MLVSGSVSKILGFPGLEVTWGHLPGTAREFLEVSPQLPVRRVVATRGAFAAICSLVCGKSGGDLKFSGGWLFFILFLVVVVAFFSGLEATLKKPKRNQTKPKLTNPTKHAGVFFF